MLAPCRKKRERDRGIRIGVLKDDRSVMIGDKANSGGQSGKKKRFDVI